jgi:glycosyltransferase involved in cell wall biosynthesis
MKILTAEKYYFVAGGASRVFFETNRLLEKHGHQVIPFSGRYEKNFATPYSSYFVPRFTLFSGEDEGRASAPRMAKAFGDALYAFDVARAIDRLVSEHKPDVAHLHTILYQLSPSLITRLSRARVPVVQTLHDFNLVCASRYLYAGGRICERCRGRRYHQALLQNCCNGNRLVSLMSFSAMTFHALFHLYPGKVDLFISPSRFLRTKMIDWGLSPKRIVHINHFLPSTRFSKEGNGAGDYFLFAGYLVRQKGIYTLLKAMTKIRGGRLLLAGRGPERAGVERFIREHGLKNVELVGFLGDKAYAEAVGRAKFVIFPSECYETFGMGILEAYLLRKPVIASDLGAYPELVRPNETGLLFQPGNADDLADKITALLRDDGRAEAMGAAARATAVRDFGEDLHYQQLMRLYERLTG